MAYAAQLSTVRGSSHFLEPIPQGVDAYDDRRGFLQKVVDRCLSLLREASYACGNIRGRVVDYFNPRFDRVGIDPSWRAESEGLYVLIHGLNGHPVIWQSHVDQLKNDQKKDLFVPYVRLKGNGPLEEVADPLLKVIEEYALNHPKKPVCLIGVSNGGRICAWLETQLRSSAPSTPVRVSTIAAVLFGTSRMDLIKRCHQFTNWSLGYNLSVVNDLCLGSEKAKEILKNVSLPLAEGVIRDFEFFASTEDSQVPEIFSSMPTLGNDLKVVNHLVHGYDHNGIVAGVSVNQIQSCKEWMNKFSSE